MRFKFRNLGILRSGTIDLGDLTIVCGANNTGKTYATYALYGLLRGISRMDLGIVSRDQLQAITGGKPVDLDLQHSVVAVWPEVLRGVGLVYQRMLPEVLATDAERLKDTEVEVEFPLPDLKPRALEESFPPAASTPFLAFSKKAGEMRFRMSAYGEPRAPAHLLREGVSGALYQLIFRDVLPPVFCASAERTGAAIFHKELNFTRTRLVEAIASLQHTKKLGSDLILPLLFPSRDTRYPLPVRDNVDFINQLEEEAGQESELAATAPEILEDFADIIGGEYKVARKSVFFKPRKVASRLTLIESSSAVRSLLDVGFFLRHRARKGHLLMIDEPELNLHPANQRRVARLLARLVNWGLRVYVTTHSDTIAKEFNSLLLLGRLGAERAPEFGYHPSEVLQTSRVRLHVAKGAKAVGENGHKGDHRTLEPVEPLPDGGFEYVSFDDTIDEMNQLQRQLWRAIDAEVPHASR